MNSCSRWDGGYLICVLGLVASDIWRSDAEDSVFALVVFGYARVDPVLAGRGDAVDDETGKCVCVLLEEVDTLYLGVDLQCAWTAAAPRSTAVRNCILTVYAYSKNENKQEGKANGNIERLCSLYTILHHPETYHTITHKLNAQSQVPTSWKQAFYTLGCTITLFPRIPSGGTMEMYAQNNEETLS